MVGFEAAVVIVLFAAAVVLFITEAIPAELVALALMTGLMLTGVVTPEEGVSGFSHPATLTILALFVISAGIYRTGVVTLAARKLALITGKSETRVLLVITLVVGPVSAFINNTAAVAILIPLVMTLAKESQTSPSKLLIPLSFISMLAGTITLIGTSTNVLASTLVADARGRGFEMFEFSMVGIWAFGAGVLYLLTIGRYLIPERIGVGEASEDVLLRHFLTEVRVREDSPLVGKTLNEGRVRERFKIDVVRILRGMRAFDQPLGNVELAPGDVLVLKAPRSRLTRLEEEAKVDILTGVRQEDLAMGGPAHVVEVVVSPNSSLVRRTLNEAQFAQEFNVKVLGLRQHGPSMFKRLGSTTLNFGDTLLVLATPEAVERMRQHPDFIVGEEEPAESYRKDKMPVAFGILAAVVGLSVLDLYPLLVVALAGAVLMVLLGVLKAEDLWTSVRWDVIFLLAGMIPLGIAMEKTGLAAAIGARVADVSGMLPSLGIIMLFYAASVLLTSIMSNNATVILLVPIAFATGAALDVNAVGLVLAVMFAASASFMTPIGYQTNLMVYGPGEYRFTDFTRVGAPLNFILLFVVSYAISVYFPL